jgi:hypothetical protein
MNIAWLNLMINNKGATEEKMGFLAWSFACRDKKRFLSQNLK